ncbi:tyrosine-type recombinase/integrase [Pseudomonas aeruginosa]|uniref:tyrosine-type recombinase/integrase n=1 Tax=Pseudomonas aeruginosa TaxID=287 RepID=UPI0023B2765F|nr:tyrosine-type recombinase/integrase [Pseudomonas aeruginosa]MDE9756763.1 tyrosine-type recombinase/integrase [Pseudomonas aeruginosa]
MKSNEKVEFILKFYDPERSREDVYDFGGFKVLDETKESIAEAFKYLTGHYAVRSRRQAWRSIIKFLRFMEGHELADDHRKRSEILINFYEFLKSGVTLNKTIGSHYNFVRRLLLWLSVNSEKDVWKEQRIGRFTIERESINIRDNDLTVAQLKNITRICKREVEEVRRRFRVRHLIEQNSDVSAPELTPDELMALRSLIDAERKGLWTQREFQGRILCHAPLRKLNSYKELTYRDAVPILLLILIQTAGNPISIMELKTSCVEDHPFDDNRCVIKWFKGRAGREQAKSFVRKGRYGVFELVRLLMEMTEPIRHMCNESDKGRLFITRSGKKAERISIQGIHNSLGKFREDNSLGKFSFSDIRKAVAGAFIRKGESVESVSALLQHKDMSTTKIYIEGREAQERKFEQLHKYQGEMLKISVGNIKIDDVPETFLGFGCKDPYAGISDGASKGQLCLQFLNCATCPNALVLIDDANSVARIVRARKRLLELKEKSVLSNDSQSRFEFIYRPILRIIEVEILSRVNKTVMHEAELLSETLPTLPAIY